jgi:hypothetical protein
MASYLAGAVTRPAIFTAASEEVDDAQTFISSTLVTQCLLFLVPIDQCTNRRCTCRDKHQDKHRQLCMQPRVNSSSADQQQSGAVHALITTSAYRPATVAVPHPAVASYVAAVVTTALRMLVASP